MINDVIQISVMNKVNKDWMIVYDNDVYLVLEIKHHEIYTWVAKSQKLSLSTR